MAARADEIAARPPPATQPPAGTAVDLWTSTASTAPARISGSRAGVARYDTAPSGRGGDRHGRHDEGSPQPCEDGDPESSANSQEDEQGERPHPVELLLDPRPVERRDRRRSVPRGGDGEDVRGPRPGQTRCPRPGASGRDGLRVRARRARTHMIRSSEQATTIRPRPRGKLIERSDDRPHTKRRPRRPQR